MPRAYFIQFLNYKAEEDEVIGDWLIDCLDLYQETQVLLSTLEWLRTALRHQGLVNEQNEVNHFTSAKEIK
jgi:hypothetical protein